jgi:phosphatidylserine decarboxylase
MAFIAIFLLVDLLITLGAAYLYARFVWFYRDPVREPIKVERAITSPADGQIVYIKEFDETGGIYSEKLGKKIYLKELSDLPLALKKEGWIVGIYMSPFDVHFNYAPVNGKVEKIAYTKAKMNVPMVDLNEYIRISYLRQAFDNFAARFHLENERNSLLLSGGDFPVGVVEIADKYVNKISCFVEEGQELKPGDKIGFIDRGSQVDLIIFKKDIDFKVKFGEQVYGGKTVIAEY